MMYECTHTHLNGMKLVDNQIGPNSYSLLCLLKCIWQHNEFGMHAYTHTSTHRILIPLTHVQTATMLLCLRGVLTGNDMADNNIKLPDNAKHLATSTNLHYHHHLI